MEVWTVTGPTADPQEFLLDPAFSNFQSELLAQFCAGALRVHQHHSF